MSDKINGLKIPSSAADIDIKKIPENEEAIIINPYIGKEKLTEAEAIDCINHLSGMLLANECIRGEKENKRYL